MTDTTPTLDDISPEDTRTFGERLVQLELGDRVRFTNDRWDHYVEGTVVNKKDEPDGRRFYEALVETDEGYRYRIHANWRDIMPDADDQRTPYTGAIGAYVNGTAPAITDLEVITGEQEER